MTQKIVIPRNDLPIRRSYLVEVPITNTGVGAKPEFQRDNVLNPDSVGSVIFTGVDVMYDSLLAKAPSGNSVITATEAGKLTTTFIWKDDEFIRQQPLVSLISAINFGMIRKLDRRQIELTKSYLTVLDAGIGANKSAVFIFYYLDPIKDKDYIQRVTTPVKR